MLILLFNAYAGVYDFDLKHASLNLDNYFNFAMFSKFEGVWL